VFKEEDNLTLVIFKVEIFGSFDQILDVKAFVNINMNLKNLFRGSCSNIFDTHSSCLTVDEYWLTGLSVKSKGEIKLSIDI
jgi:hypothetical protein